MSMTPAARKLAAELSGRSGPGRRPSAEASPAVVVTVTAGAAEDGNALCVVTWRGDDHPVAYPASYTPVVGHNVLCLYQEPSLVIIAHMIGTPP